MARHWFGNGLADWSFSSVTVDGEDDIPQLAGGVEVTFWNMQSGGTRYTDLVVDGQPADSVTTSTGGDFEVGTIPDFRGPDGVRYMWADGGAGRYVIVAWDIGDDVADLLADLSTVSGDVDTHVGASNPHATRVRDLDDTDTVATGQVSDGQVLGFHASSGLWLPVDVEGITGVAQVGEDNTFTGLNTFQNSAGGETLDDVSIDLPARSDQVGDLFRCRNGNGQRTGYANENGELRVIASANNTVPFRVKQRSGSQSGNLTEWTTIDYPGPGDILARVDAQGRVRAGNTMMAPWIFSLPPGQVTTGAGRAVIWNDSGVSLRIRNVRATVGVAPTGADLVVDVNRNGSSIFDSAGDQPTIPDGSTTSGKNTAMATVTLNDGDRVTIDVDQVGSSTPGEDLVVQLVVH